MKSFKTTLENMKSAFKLLLVFLFTSWGALSQDLSIKVNVTKYLIGTTTDRNLYVVPSGEAWMFYNTTLSRWEYNVSGGGWVALSGTVSVTAGSGNNNKLIASDDSGASFEYFDNIVLNGASTMRFRAEVGDYNLDITPGKLYIESVSGVYRWILGNKSGYTSTTNDSTRIGIFPKSDYSQDGFEFDYTGDDRWEISNSPIVTANNASGLGIDTNTSDDVTLTTIQTISGAKTFSNVNSFTGARTKFGNADFAQLDLFNTSSLDTLQIGVSSNDVQFRAGQGVGFNFYVDNYYSGGSTITYPVLDVTPAGDFLFRSPTGATGTWRNPAGTRYMRSYWSDNDTWHLDPSGTGDSFYYNFLTDEFRFPQNIGFVGKSIDKLALNYTGTPSANFVATWGSDPNALTFVDPVTLGGGGSGHTIQDEGVAETARTNLNFVGALVDVTDDAGNDATVVTISGDGTGTDDQTAGEVSYSNATSGLAATTVQGAIDEVVAEASLVGEPTATATRNAALTDVEGVVNVNSAGAVTITIPTNATVAFPVGTILTYRQEGAGDITLAYSGGVTGVAIGTFGAGHKITIWQTSTDVWEALSVPAVASVTSTEYMALIGTDRETQGTLFVTTD